MKKLALCARPLAVLILLVGLARCTEPPYLTAIQVLPNAPVAGYVGQTIQFKAFGTYNRGGSHPSQMQDITNQVDWLSSATTVATIGANGLATTTGMGATPITASLSAINTTVTL